MMGILIAWGLFDRIFPFLFTFALNALYFGVVRYG
jgi:hypothetical protein